MFGCVTYAHIPKEERKKLDSKAKLCILLGYGTNVKGYRLYCLQERRIIYSRHVIFDETEYGLEKEQVENKSEADKLVEIDLPDDECEISQNIQEKVHQVEGESSNEVTRDESTETNSGLRRSNHERQTELLWGVGQFYSDQRTVSQTLYF